VKGLVLVAAMVAAFLASTGCADTADGGPQMLQSSGGLTDGNASICRAQLFARPVATSSVWVAIGAPVDLPLGQTEDAAVTAEPLIGYQGTSVYLSLEVAGGTGAQSCQAMLLVKPSPQSELMDMVGQPVAIAPNPSDELMTPEPVTNSKNVNESVYLLLYGG
jgi:hypothetical protein